MSTDLRTFLGPLIAVIILGVVGFQTQDALRKSGTWGPHKAAKPRPAVDPYAALETSLASPDSIAPASSLRDPFNFARAPQPVTRTVRVITPAPPPKPLLTAIVSGADPRALVRYQDHDYTIKAGDQFADFKVISITADAVILERGGQRLSLNRPTKGEQ